MPRGVLVVLSQRVGLPASSLCSLGSLVFTADLLLWIRHALWARSLIMVYTWLLPAPRSGIPLMISYSLLFSLPHFSHIPLTL